MRYLKSTIRLTVAVLLLAALGALTGQAAAQSPTDISAVRPVTDVRSNQNAVRIDIGGIVASNLANSAFNSDATPLLPILVAYERQVSRRFSLVAEGLVNGGEPSERKAGLSVQGRWYPSLGRTWPALLGFYGAPVLSYRAVKFNSYYEPVLRRHFVGVGALLGCQAPLKRQSRLIIDISLGVMNWQKLGTVANPLYEPQAYYENDALTFDGRLGIGFRF